jgi:hypothetical protein
MQIEDIVRVRFGIGNEIDMEDGNRGWNLEDIAGDSLNCLKLATPRAWPHPIVISPQGRCKL